MPHRADVPGRGAGAAVLPQPDGPRGRDLDAGWLIPAYVALGSNLDDPRAQVERALDALAGIRDSRLVLRSSLYRSRPFGPVEQPDFINATAGLLTTLSPAELLAELQSARDSPRARASGRALGPAADRSRPARARHGPARRAGTDAASPGHRGPRVRPRAAGRDRSGPDGARARPGARVAGAAWTVPASSGSRRERAGRDRTNRSRPRTASSSSRARSASARRASRAGSRRASAASSCWSRATRIRSSSGSTATRARRPSRRSCTSCSSGRGRCRSSARRTSSSASACPTTCSTRIACSRA